MRMRGLVRGGLAVLTGMALAGGTSIALASTGSPALVGEIRAQGHCSGASNYEQAMEQDIGVEMEIHIETGVADQPWNVEMRYNGHLVFRGVQSTEADGGFEIKKQPPNKPGDDEFKATLRNTITGETCQGTLTAPL
jgi:hypothetical protein